MFMIRIFHGVVFAFDRCDVANAQIRRRSQQDKCRFW